MKQRFLHKTEQLKNPLIRRRNELLEERAGTIGKFDKAKREELAEIEDQLDVLHNSPTDEDLAIVCFKCDKAIHTKRQEYFTMTVYCVVKHLQEDEQGARAAIVDYFTPMTAAKIERGEADLVVQLAPPDSGEVALCEKCHSKFGDYLEKQEV